MEERKDKQPKGSNTTDPQEREKDGNIFGGAFDAIVGDSEGGNSISEDEADDLGKQESIKD